MFMPTETIQQQRERCYVKKCRCLTTALGDKDLGMQICNSNFHIGVCRLKVAIPIIFEINFLFY